MSDYAVNKMEYQEFLRNKMQRPKYSGFEVSESDIHPKLFKFQNAAVRWALRLGKAALFEECGLGKTFQQIEWARLVHEHTNGQVVILAPLAVAHQTIAEGAKIDVKVTYCKDDSEVQDNAIVITNYERLDKFDTSRFIGVVLDESSILKSYTGKTKQDILARFEMTPYKLACTATPAPNDHMELGNHAEFLGIMQNDVMLASWFVNDTAHTRTWRLKKHAESDFWRWLTSWGLCVSIPRDLGEEYHIPDFTLPPIEFHSHFLRANQAAYDRAHENGMLFPMDNPSSIKLHTVKRESLQDRVDAAQQIVASLPDDTSIILWCDTNYEADALVKAFPDALEVRGSHSITQKEERLDAFSQGQNRMIITKPDIAGFGLNWQHCHEMIFVGVSYSFEKLYQSMRRSWRFGQRNTVNVHIIYAETEGNVMKRLEEKQKAFAEMQTKMNEAMSEHGLFREHQKMGLSTPENNHKSGKGWSLYQGDCVPTSALIASDSIGFSVYSPPFSQLFIYSDSEADMGNAATDDEFFEHYKYLISEMYRITQPGRLSAVHVSDIPQFKWKDGAVGLKDFSGEVVRAHIEAGWIYHSRITIWKNPVVEMQRTKALGLLHKQFKKDSVMSRVGYPDYVVVFRKPGENPDPVQQRREKGDYIGTDAPLGSEPKADSYSIELWQRYASPVWFDIDQTNVLNYQQAKGNKDEKHICPLQLDVIARSIDLWTNKGDVVFSPFAGIGSEGYEAVKMGRQFIGVELKPEYFNVAVKNLKEAERIANQADLFSFAGVEVV